MIPDFFHPGYLAEGSPIQRKAFLAIEASGILNILKDVDPVLVGTLPLDLFTDKSDIDILCCFQDDEDFAEKIFFDLHTILPNFYINRKDLNGVASLITNFEHEGFKFEIVGQAIPVKQQAAYRHMVAEWKILSENDALFKRKIFELKESGIKTEPAFAKVLGLTGDPYEELLRL